MWPGDVNSDRVKDLNRKMRDLDAELATARQLVEDIRYDTKAMKQKILDEYEEYEARETHRAWEVGLSLINDPLTPPRPVPPVSVRSEVQRRNGLI